MQQPHGGTEMCCAERSNQAGMWRRRRRAMISSGFLMCLKSCCCSLQGWGFPPPPSQLKSRIEEAGVSWSMGENLIYLLLFVCLFVCLITGSSQQLEGRNLDQETGIGRIDSKRFLKHRCQLVSLRCNATLELQERKGKGQWKIHSWVSHIMLDGAWLKCIPIANRTCKDESDH